MRSIFLIILVLAVMSCERKETDATAILEADATFSSISETKGFPEAFIQYADNNATILRSDNEPIKGFESINNFYNSLRGSSVKLIWEPIHAEIAQSGELGYTYGKYFTISNDSLGTEKKQVGYYISVWKKQEDGSWKYILDGGTDAKEVD